MLYSNHISLSPLLLVPPSLPLPSLPPPSLPPPSVTHSQSLPEAQRGAGQEIGWPAATIQWSFPRGSPGINMQRRERRRRRRREGAAWHWSTQLWDSTKEIRRSPQLPCLYDHCLHRLPAVSLATLLWIEREKFPGLSATQETFPLMAYNLVFPHVLVSNSTLL